MGRIVTLVRKALLEYPPMRFHHLRQVHNPETLEMLVRVFDEAFLLALEERAPLDDPEDA